MKDEITVLSSNPSLKDMYLIMPDITYCTRGCKELKLSIIAPWDRRYDSSEKMTKLPLVVFLQGSGWTTPDYNPQLPQMAEIAKKGYVVAMVGHRDAREGNRFPAYLVDVKCAIRFLRKNAEEYGIDPERVLFWGTSSGGNTAMLVGMTGDDPRYKTEEYAEYSDAVEAVVSCFGPMDLIQFGNDLEDKPDLGLDELFNGLYGEGDPEERIKMQMEMSPLYQLQEGKDYPPFLLMHGTDDILVNYSQMVKMVSKLKEYGANVTAYAVQGAPHEESFWGREVLGIITDYIAKHSSVCG